MNVHDSGVGARVIKGVGDWLVQMAPEPFGCWFYAWYESPLPEEILQEMLAEDTQ
jgi:hypothetical protein